MSNVAGLEKAFLETVDRERLTCRFNPREYTIATGASWHKTPTKDGKAPRSEFVGSNPRTLSVELFFDAWESGQGVTADIAKLLRWTEPTPRSVSDRNPNPPIVYFAWGSFWSVGSYLHSVSVKYTLFALDGTPLRATASVSLEEVPNAPPGQNPTSGGEPGMRRHVLRAGQTLQSVAYAEYGDATRWRALAHANDIDDPLRVAPGTALLVPPLPSATARS